MHTNTHSHMHTHTQIHTHTRTHTDTHIHTYTHKDTHTHTSTHIQWHFTGLHPPPPPTVNTHMPLTKAGIWSMIREYEQFLTNFRIPQRRTPRAALPSPNRPQCRPQSETGVRKVRGVSAECLAAKGHFSCRDCILWPSPHAEIVFTFHGLMAQRCLKRREIVHNANCNCDMSNILFLILEYLSSLMSDFQTVCCITMSLVVSLLYVRQYCHLDISKYLRSNENLRRKYNILLY